MEDKRCGTCGFFDAEKGFGCKNKWEKVWARQDYSAMRENDGQYCCDWKPKEDTHFPQCQTCANWQNKIHHRVFGGELIYECKQSHVVFPTNTLTKYYNCWEKPKEKRRIWKCLNCGEDIYFKSDKKQYYHTESCLSHCKEHTAGIHVIHCVATPDPCVEPRLEE